MVREMTETEKKFSNRTIFEEPQASVYKHWGKEGELLYVGLAKDPLSRNVSHLAGIRHRYEIANITFEWFDTREEASAAESESILREKPKYNKVTRDQREITVRLLGKELDRLDELRGSRTRSAWIRRLINGSD